MAVDTVTINIDTVEKELWDKIVETAEGGGSGAGLPKVTSDDNGDLLGVVEGAWGKVDPPTGGEAFTVTFTRESDTWTADKTIAEILTAHAAGKSCVCNGDFLEGGFNLILPLALAVGGDEPFLGFSGVFGVEQFSNVEVLGIVESSVDTWTVVTDSTLPSVTSSDNGSLLGVSGGAWAKVADKSPLIVNGTQSGLNVTITTPLADIKAAFDAGRSVYLQFADMRLTIIACYEEDNSINLSFTAVSCDEAESTVSAVTVYFDGTTTGVLINRTMTGT